MQDFSRIDGTGYRLQTSLLGNVRELHQQRHYFASASLIDSMTIGSSGVISGEKR
jgi:hypothetical protein